MLFSQKTPSCPSTKQIGPATVSGGEKQPRALWVLRAVVCSFEELPRVDGLCNRGRAAGKKIETAPNGPRGH